ncbi:Pol-like polyprotein/retrotransposon, putative [Medicago truncatula]|uniref:Pol-like polyprotein/retrotransposon, putative n=1 Tax=Medicago truncatula TaxID=3880 RepID=G7IFF7_MEDTR|nr:Pol-like polyprotein/retrotransposon, putative [Medicago truncatula]
MEPNKVVYLVRLGFSVSSVLSKPLTSLTNRMLTRKLGQVKVGYFSNKYLDLSQLTQFLDAPTDEPMLAGLHVLKFLKNNRGKRLFFSSSPSLTLKGFSHSDWGACQDTRRSTIGFCFFHGIKIFIKIANPVFHERTKHIEIDCHVVRDKVQAGLIHLLPVSSKEQVADIFTRPLHHGPFNTLQIKLGTIIIHSSLRGTIKG